MLSATGRRRVEDPATSRDPRIRALVAQLVAVPASTPAAEPSAPFRADLRAQLVAIAPRLIAEGAAETGTPLAPRTTFAPTALERADVPDLADARDGADTLDADTPDAAEPVAAPVLRSLPGGAAPRPGGAKHADVRPRHTRHLARPLAIAASVITVLAIALGGAVGLSRHALPGDALYGLKRTAERVELSTTGSSTGKAHDLLHFAATRAAEVQGLLHRSGISALGGDLGASSGVVAGGTVSASTATLIMRTLASSDTDVAQASRLLGTAAVQQRSGTPLTAMSRFAPEQLARLNAIAAALPAGPLRARAESSAALVTAARTRAETLRATATCSCVQTSVSDQLGPLPCDACPASLPSSRSTSPSSPVGPHTSASTASSTTRRHQVGKPRSTTAPGSVRRSPPVLGTIPTTPSVRPSVRLPSLPHLTPSVPRVHVPTAKVSTPKVKVASCSVSISAGPLSVHLPLCTSGTKTKH